MSQTTSQRDSFAATDFAAPADGGPGGRAAYGDSGDAVAPEPGRTYAPLGPYNVDRRLIAAVQVSAGAHCHTSANLLHCYQLSALAYDDAVACNDAEGARSMLESLNSAEVELRRFLGRCRRSYRDG